MSNHSDLFLSELTHRCYWDFQIKVNVFNSLLFKLFLVDILYQCKGFFFSCNYGVWFSLLFAWFVSVLGTRYWTQGKHPTTELHPMTFCPYEKSFPVVWNSLLKCNLYLNLWSSWLIPSSFWDHRPVVFVGWLVGLAQYLNLASSLWPSCFVSSGAMVRGVNPHADLYSKCRFV